MNNIHIKYKFIDSNYDEKTGISTVTIQTKDGLFTGTSKLHEEDKDIPSKFAGCRYAELKAVIKALKYQAKVVKIKYKAVEDVFDELSKSCELSSDNKEFCIVTQKLAHLWKEYTNLCLEIDDREEALLYDMQMRGVIVRNRNKNNIIKMDKFN